MLAGSIPSSLPSDIYENILERMEGKQILAAVDATKELLCNVLKYHPFLIKPNHIELGEIFGVQLHTERADSGVCRRLQQMGARNVLISMAGDGAILLDESGGFIESTRRKEPSKTRWAQEIHGGRILSRIFAVEGLPDCLEDGNCRRKRYGIFRPTGDRRRGFGVVSDAQIKKER